MSRGPYSSGVKRRVVRSARAYDWIDARTKRRVGDMFVSIPESREVLRAIDAGHLIEQSSARVVVEIPSVPEPQPQAPQEQEEETAIVADDDTTDAERPRQRKRERKSRKDD